MTISQDTKDLVDLISKVVIPFFLFAFGLILVRAVERQKTQAGRESDFTKKWAELFLETSLTFVNASERFWSVLQQLITEPPEAVQKKFHEELWTLAATMGELGMRIERLATNSETYGSSVANAANALHDELRTLLRTKVGHTETIKKLQLDFTNAVRKAHSEMLQIK